MNQNPGLRETVVGCPNVEWGRREGGADVDKIPRAPSPSHLATPEPGATVRPLDLPARKWAGLKVAMRQRQKTAEEKGKTIEFAYFIQIETGSRPKIILNKQL